MRSPPKVAVIGAGVGGMAVANLLAKAGFETTVFEKNGHLGGRMGVFEAEGFRFDMGPSWYLMPEVFDHYFELMGEKRTDYYGLTKLQPAYQIFFQGRESLIIHSNEKIDGENFEKFEKGSSKQLKKYLDLAEKSYKNAMRYFLYNPLTNVFSFLKLNILKNFLFLLSQLLTPIHSYIKKFFKNPLLQKVFEYPMVFLGASPFKAPALYHLMSYLDFRQGVFYPDGGMYSIIESFHRIAKKWNVEIRTNTPVKSIHVKNGIAKSLELENGEILEYDFIVSDADLHFTEMKLLTVENRSYPKEFWEKKVAGPSALLIYLGIEDAVPEFQHHNVFFVENWKDNFDSIFEEKKWPSPASIYVCKPGQTDPTVAPNGTENLFILVPLPADLSVVPNDIEQWANQYIEQIETMGPVKNLKSRIKFKKIFSPKDFEKTYHSWKGTALGLSHTLLQSAFFRPSNRSQKVKNLFYVGGNVQPGVGIPMCLIGAEIVLKLLFSISSSKPLKKLPKI